MLLAVRIDAERAAFLGIDVKRQRIWAFTLAGAIAAFTGALLAPWTQIIATDTVQRGPEKRPANLTVLSVSLLLGEAISRIHTGESVGALFGAPV